MEPKNNQQNQTWRGQPAKLTKIEGPYISDRDRQIAEQWERERQAQQERANQDPWLK